MCFFFMFFSRSARVMLWIAFEILSQNTKRAREMHTLKKNLSTLLNSYVANKFQFATLLTEPKIIFIKFHSSANFCCCCDFCMKIIFNAQPIFCGEVIITHTHTSRTSHIGITWSSLRCIDGSSIPLHWMELFSKSQIAFITGARARAHINEHTNTNTSLNIRFRQNSFERVIKCKLIRIECRWTSQRVFGSQ